jgi:hypothetical protein
MYSHWYNYPQQGYEMIPSVFWMWSNANAQRIKQWTDKSSHHWVITGGNPWLSYNIAHEITQGVSSQLAENLKSYKKVVLISLQYSVVPDFLLKAIATEKDIFWFIRLHPRFIHEKKEIENILSKLPYKNYNIEEANQLPIYSLFQVIDVLVTFWSTVAYEALAFGVPTILIHKNGRDAMEEYINKHIFHYTEDSQEIINLIQHSETSFKPEEEKYIEFDKQLIQSNLAFLLKSASD